MNEESKIKMKISELLRNPGGCIDNVRSTANMGLIMVFLTMVAVTGSGAFGFAIGSFAGWDVAAIDALKMAGVMLFSFFLCYPMLYVFACLGGCELNPFRLMAVGLVCMAILGCLLAALAPIMWLFAVSTESVGFIVFFACALTICNGYLVLRIGTDLSAPKGEWLETGWPASVEDGRAEITCPDLILDKYRERVATSTGKPCSALFLAVFLEPRPSNSTAISDIIREEINPNGPIPTGYTEP